MSCRTRLCRRPGFSLVELLTVVSIIALLISILLPSIAAIQKRVKSAATQNMIQVISTGIETFKADPGVGGAYPESAVRATNVANATQGAVLNYGVINPHTNSAPQQPSAGNRPIGGASFLAWALVGADLLGTPGFRDLNGNGSWRDDTGKADPKYAPLYALDGNQQPFHQRSGPFVDQSRMKFPQVRSDGYYSDKYNAGPIASICFLDAFERPILYYRANPAGTFMASRQDSGALGPGYYDIFDNAGITGVEGGPSPIPGLAFGSAIPWHPISKFGDPNNPGNPSNKGSFCNVIWDPNVTAARRPHRPDSYILLSAGPDGRYGTSDDLANFPINK